MSAGEMHRAQGLAMIAFQLDRLASLQAELSSIQADASSLLPAPALSHLSDSITSWTDADATAAPADDSSLYHTTASFMPVEEGHIMPAEEGHEAVHTARAPEPGHAPGTDAGTEASLTGRPEEVAAEEVPLTSKDAGSAMPDALPTEQGDSSAVASAPSAVTPASKAVDLQLQPSPDHASAASTASGIHLRACFPDPSLSHPVPFKLYQSCT